jgi:NCS1 family nucleobase:cation symporter-1
MLLPHYSSAEGQSSLHTFQGASLNFPQMRGLVYAKLIVFIISAIAMCAWTLSLAGGIGEVARQPGTAHGSTKAWLMVRFFLLGAASCATFASNAADFQRYATKPNDVLLGNLVGFPLSNVSSVNARLPA